MLLAADASASGPPWLAVALAVFTLLGVIATAAFPALAERIKRGSKPKDGKSEATTPPPAPTVVQRTDQALDLVERAMVDAQRERDTAQDEVKELLREIGRLQAELYRRDPMWNGDISGRSPS